MRKFVKFIAIAMLLAISLSLSGCIAPKGTYELYSIEYDNEVIIMGSNRAIEEGYEKDDFVLELNGMFKASVYQDGKKLADGFWVQFGRTVIVAMNNIPQTFNLDGDFLVYQDTTSSVESFMTLKKVQP